MMNFKSPVLAGLFVFLGLLVGCTSETQRMSAKPVEKVNDHLLTAKEFSQELARSLKNFDALAAKDPHNIARAKENILNEFLVKSLTLDWAKSKSISVPDHVLDKEVNRIRASYPDDLTFRRSLAQESLSFSEWREKLRYSIIEKEVFKKLNENTKTPSDSEIEKFYEANKDKFKRKESIFIRQIVVDEKAKAEAIKMDLKKADFADLAKKFSITPEGKKGGEVGWIEKGTVDYFDPLFSSGSGVQTLESPVGVHLIRVEKKMGVHVLPLSSVKPQIIRDLRAQREQAEYVAWLDAQLRSSKVFKDHDLINSIRVDTRGTHD